MQGISRVITLQEQCASELLNKRTSNRQTGSCLLDDPLRSPFIEPQSREGWHRP
ncbi:UNVERIFIED_CONTAM: hypothetical protein FKN15_032554 [Acipenser sinensis]